MYTGRMIDELIESVQRAEKHADTMKAAEVKPVTVDVHQVRNTFIYNFSYSQEHIGVA